MRALAHAILVMKDGRIVEGGLTERLMTGPGHRVHQNRLH
jgi:ABC-type microcin C transport system duplicated ATPase subunit YejF